MEKDQDGITTSPQIDMDVDHKNGKLIAKAIDDWNNPIGRATFNIGDNNELDPQHVEVNEKHRKSGVAKKIYDHVASRGYKIIRSSDQTDSGNAFWNKHQGTNSKFWRTQKDNGGGITAYHGSPHEFDQFDISNIGTGEGAQSFGHGLYFAEAEPVAKSYRDALSGDPISKEGVKPDWRSRGSKYLAQSALAQSMDKKLFGDEAIHDAMQDLHKNAGLAERKDIKQRYYDAVNSLGQMLGKDWSINPGHMYEVKINAHPDHFLDWDKPLRDQPEIIRRLSGWSPEHEKIHREAESADANNLMAALEGDADYTPAKMPIRPQGALPMSATGEDIYEHFKNKMGAVDWPIDADAETRAKYRGSASEKASQYLASHGIKGIKYLDAGSRDKGEGSRNYVVFDHNDVNIKRRYEQGGAVEGEREGFGFGGDTEFAGSGPVRGASGTVAASRQESPQSSYRDMPNDLREIQSRQSARNEEALTRMKDENAANKQRSAEQSMAWAAAGFPAGGPKGMALGEESRPTAYAMSPSNYHYAAGTFTEPFNVKPSMAQSPQEVIASMVPAAGTPTKGYDPLAIAAGTPVGGYNPVAQAAGTPTSGYNQIAQAAGTPTQGYNPSAPQPVEAPIKLASLGSSTFKSASPVPPVAPQSQGKGGRRLVKKLMPDGSYQDVWEEYATGGKVKYPLAGKGKKKITDMPPQEFLDRSRPLTKGKEDRRIIEGFKKDMKGGKQLDPLALYEGGKENGRHRATAAKELGIKKVPVHDYRKRDGGAIVKHALMIISKKA